jgi:hypothetical protein
MKQRKGNCFSIESFIIYSPERGIPKYLQVLASTLKYFEVLRDHYSITAQDQYGNDMKYV